MKTCPTCGRQYAETTTLCPADGAVLNRNRRTVVLLDPLEES